MIELLAPCEKFPNRPSIRAARVRVADVGDEEFPKARLRAVTGGGDKDRGSIGNRDELVHGPMTLVQSTAWPASFSSLAKAVFHAPCSS